MPTSPTIGNGTVTSSPLLERDSSRSPDEDMTIVLHEPQGSNEKTKGVKGKIRVRKGKNAAVTSNSLIESERLESTNEDIAVVPHDPEGTDREAKCRKVKKRGRHFDREVRAHILQVCLSPHWSIYTFIFTNYTKLDGASANYLLLLCL